MDKPLKQIPGILGTGRGLGVVLDRVGGDLDRHVMEGRERPLKVLPSFYSRP